MPTPGKFIIYIHHHLHNHHQNILFRYLWGCCCPESGVYNTWLSLTAFLWMSLSIGLKLDRLHLTISFFKQSFHVFFLATTMTVKWETHLMQEEALFTCLSHLSHRVCKITMTYLMLIVCWITTDVSHHWIWLHDSILWQCNSYDKYKELKHTPKTLYPKSFRKFIKTWGQ